ncbi:MAG: C/D box methylation guide ribonucleoprotein complex aNOP56 subunit [Candidatus Hermodarchaeota archaeon]|nr:C/D box methylation guide ribonucleoprotein complex aNOP56 subunit [Candidatus Hermodarchaeota archaeon]
MNGFLVLSCSELYCLDEDFSILGQLKLGDSIEEVSLILNRMRRGLKDQGIFDFVQELNKKGVNQFFVEDISLANEFASIYDVKVLPYEDVSVWRRMRQEFRGFHLTKQDRQELHDVAVELSRRAIREVSQKGDQLVIQAMSSLDDAEKIQNLMTSRLREWYGLHFPEASHKIEDAQSLARIVSEGGHRDTISKVSDLQSILIESHINPDLLSQSMGADLPDQDMMMIQGLARQYLELQRFREGLEKYLDELMQEIAPNLRGLIGPMIGARLIALAGGLDRLARLPASTIQVLGAEQALFRALKTGANPPKHGVIFQYTSIHSAPWWQRGKIARILSGKIAIAARIDLFSGEYIADQLKQNVQSRIGEIKRKYPTAPKTVSKPSSKTTRRKPGKKRRKPHASQKTRNRRRDR